MTPLERNSLKSRVLKAGAWSFAGYGLGQAIRFGSNLVLTRLLVPEMFGIMAIAFLVMTCLGMFSDLGLNISAIQSKRGRDPAFLNTVWTVQIIRGAVLWLVALAISLVLLLADDFGMVPRGSVYADPRLPYVIAIISITAVVSGAASTKTLEARRDLALGRITRIDMVTQLAALVVMFGWVAIDRSIWALAAASIFSALVSAVLSHVWLPGVSNRWEWDKSAFDEIINLGKWIFLSSIISFLVSNGDRFVLAGLVGSTVFGVYVVAFMIFSSVDQVLGKIISDVSFPALSEIARERRPDLRASYYKFYVPIASFAYFCSGFLMVSGATLIGLLYDRRYEDAGWMLQILAASLFATPLRLATQCFLVFGISRIFSHILSIRFVVLYLGMSVGFHLFGLPGALFGIVLGYFSALPMIIVYAMKYGLLDWRKELQLLSAVVVGMMAAVAFNYAIDQVRELLHSFALIDYAKALLLELKDSVLHLGAK